MSKPLAIDLYAGLGGWTEGLLSEGWDVVGFDIERHVYGDHRYPAQLVLQDVLTLHGSQLRDAALIVASSPCQAYSYMAMPWTRAKQIAAALRGKGPFPDGYQGPRSIAELNALFLAPRRIQREASEAAGRWIPMVQENVCGAQPWVGPAAWHYGSYYLWGGVPALMPITTKGVMKEGVAHRSNGETNFHASAKRAVEGVRVGGFTWSDFGKPGYVGQAFNHAAERTTENTGGSWFSVAHNTTSGTNNNPARGHSVGEGVKVGGGWFHDSTPGAISSTSSKSSARKAASARIAKIPFALAQHIAHVYYPSGVQGAS